MNIILPKWMYTVKIVYSYSIAFIALNVFLNHKSTIATIVVSRNILPILKTDMIRRIEYNLSI